VPLFPVQLIEAISLAAILSVNVFLILTRAPGVAFAWYIAAYAILRFALEFLRGDPGRPTVAGFSEAQWTSLALSLGAGILYPGCRVVAGLLAAWMLIVTIARGMRKAPRHRLLHPSHVQEMAEALQRTRGLHVESTSMGIRISAGEIRQGGSRVFHYAFSSSGAPLSGHAAEVLAALVVNLRHSAEGPTRLTAGNSDVFHLLVHPMRPEG
jgi:hypothetical protein